MLGFDTLYDNHADDAEIRRVAGAEARTVLTRDRDLLICRDVTHGCYVHALKAEAQLREVVVRLQLASQAKPFTRCLHCNHPLEPIAKAQVQDRLPPRVAARHQTFRHCPCCDRVYWPGDHYRRMSEMLKGLVPAAMVETPGEEGRPPLRPPVRPAVARGAGPVARAVPAASARWRTNDSGRRRRRPSSRSTWT